MKRLVMRAIRGGLGATTLLADLALALHEQGERVLLVDLSPDNMLRLHFNVDTTYEAGWARAQLDGSEWNDAALEMLPGLHLLPYGRLNDSEVAQIELQLCADSSCWSQRCGLVSRDYDWILFDLPQRLPGHRVGVSEDDRADLLIDLATTDPACHVLLQQRTQPIADLLLVNRVNPASQLQRDLLMIWRRRPGMSRPPQLVHEDEAAPEALAHKMTIGHYAPQSQAASDLRSLAIWCLAQRAEC
ncbi:cellulose synthase operon protein YhjQ [Pseudomonas sp. KSR10]|jgi:cellulose synthase operon protein YhjQ|uniref:Cellulose synthase n=1 Tax=Stutzerimonas stutzeri TaxID=316 RepID=A0A0D9AJX7_STUST|nr:MULTISPECIES: cellulose biosynthesis protein BcsQ [Pseudomonadaceae]KJH79671.1 cellulose synthase [Stutzerimonas stutzeri]MCG6541292.1 cellulose synthase operon protein YhjQ [Pseudomonas sp. KSR10]